MSELSKPQEMKAHCAKCGEALIYVTSVPHPRSPEMQRTTFVCYPCNRTWSYSLSPAMAEAYALAAPPLPPLPAASPPASSSADSRS